MAYDLKSIPSMELAVSDTEKLIASIESRIATLDSQKKVCATGFGTNWGQCTSDNQTIQSKINNETSNLNYQKQQLVKYKTTLNLINESPAQIEINKRLEIEKQKETNYTALYIFGGVVVFIIVIVLLKKFVL